MKMSLWYLVPIINWLFIFFDKHRFKDEGEWLMFLFLICIYNLIVTTRALKDILTIIMLYSS